MYNKMQKEATISQKWFNDGQKEVTQILLNFCLFDVHILNNQIITFFILLQVNSIYTPTPSQTCCMKVVIQSDSYWSENCLWWQQVIRQVNTWTDQQSSGSFLTLFEFETSLYFC